jgi:hypothetical protein
MVDRVLQGEPRPCGSGGDVEAALPMFPSAVVKAAQRDVELKLPIEGSGYCLFAYVRGGHGGGAMATPRSWSKRRRRGRGVA